MYQGVYVEAALAGATVEGGRAGSIFASSERAWREVHQQSAS